MGRSIRLIEYVRSIVGIIFFTLLFILVIPISFILVLFMGGRLGDLAVQRFAPAIAIPVMKVIGIHYKRKYHGPRFTQPAMYIINHSSTLDILTLMALGIPKLRYVAKWELQYFPIFFIMGKLTGQVFIKRQNSEKAVSTLQKTYNHLKRNNRSVMIAPEGSRKHEGIIGPFKKGAFRMAIDLGYPIVPIYFEGNNELSIGGSIMSKSGTLTTHFHPSIDTSNWSIETLDEHIEEVRDLYLKWAGVEG
ncbi:MAG: 1-acylglycerol-3-phosphate O-acyltransferase [Balneola sp.]|nr:MAG: 1-acylglycerol-3-phosphate O-acyltransferase [Balneola sp.]